MRITPEAVWAQFTAAILLAIVALLMSSLWHPPVGVYIAILALVGVLVPLIRGDRIGPREKALWTALMFALVLLEINSIYKEQREHDKEQAEARQEDQNHFNDTVAHLSDVLLSTNRLLILEDQAKQAEEKHSSSQLAEIRRQQKQTRALVNNSNRALLLNNAFPRLITQMQNMYDPWNLQETTERHKYPRGKGDPQYLQESAQFAKDYSRDLKPLMMNAKSLNEQLLSTVPLEAQRRLGLGVDMIPMADKVISGETIQVNDLMKTISYLNGTVRKVSSLPPEQEEQLSQP